MKWMPFFLRPLGLVLFAMLMSVHIAAAQLTLTKNSIEGFFNTEFSYTTAMSHGNDNILPLINTVGADQTWDFTTLNFDFTMSGTGFVEVFSSAEGTPGEGDEHLEQATHVMHSVMTIRGTIDGEEVEMDMVHYEYAIINEEEFRVLGNMVMDFGESGEVDMLIRNIPGELRYQFPVSYQSTWSFEYEEQMESGFFNTTLDYIVDVEVDGWGQLITPDGTFEVLRVTRTEKMDLGFFLIESLEVEFVDKSGIPIASLMIGIDPTTGELDTESAEASLNVISTGTSSEREIAADLPDRAELHQNYPNPFNPSTTITYNIPEASHVQLEVYDMSGRQVDVLVNEVRPAGSHSVGFDAGNLASGVYMYRLRAGDHQSTKRLTLIK